MPMAIVVMSIHVRRVCAWQTANYSIKHYLSIPANSPLQISIGYPGLPFAANLTNWKAVLSQRWPRNAPNIWVPWKFSGLPDYAHGYFSKKFSWVFVLIEPMNVHTKFKVRSFTHSWDNRGYPKIGQPWICPRSFFSNIL